ncbi:sugar phosphate isomerase/epimerase family protein [Paenibacillus sp. S-38]|uniref:sugar phosphate isomerase/epimerase family protein n=1 Tax=Paenibacillus sp. S-38 TaxID=3416710 RepID=UPI003CE83372
MKTSLCTISFRHQLVSFGDLVRLASRLQFDGIELWGTHAQQLYENERVTAWDHLQRLHASGMGISMVSDYLDISPQADRQAVLDKCQRLISLARWFGTPRVRTFAGQLGSRDVPAAERPLYAENLHRLCELCGEQGVYLLLEMHPGTLTDTVESALDLLRMVNHPALKINLDFLHVWEGGTDPVEGLRKLEPWVMHYHMKNITDRSHLGVFAPHNVYAPSGSRTGMVPLREGVVDYRPILEAIRETDHYASLEWFGPDPARVLAEEMQWLREELPVAMAGA